MLTLADIYGKLHDTFLTTKRRQPPRRDCMPDPAGELPDTSLHNDSRFITMHGRNQITAASTGDGHRVHVKHFVGDGAAGRYRTTVAFDAWARGQHFEHLRYAPVVEHSSTPPSVATEWVFGAPLRYGDLIAGTGAERSRTPSPLAAVSASLAELHDLEPPVIDGSIADRLSIRERICRSALYLSVEAYTRSSAGVLALWSMVHEDRALVEAISAIADQDRRRARDVPAHADLRLDQILWNPSSNIVTVVDWEEFRADDPSLDLGSLIGDLLFTSLVDSLGELDPGTDAHHGAEAAVRRATEEGVTNIAHATKLIWSSYAGHRTGRVPHVNDVGRTIGLHLLDRVLAHATAGHELSVLMRCVLGIARTAITSPSTAVAALGLEQA